MAGKRVAVLDPDGRFGTVDETDVANLPDGARVLSSKEIAQRELAAEYASKSTAQKIAGAATSTFAGPIVSNAAAASGAVAVPPEVEAFQSKMPTGLTLGADRALTRKALDAVGAPGAGQAYAEHQQKLTTAHGGLQTAGELTGFAASAFASPTGAARLAPGLGMAAAGGAVERGVARALGGLAAKGALGRAATTGAGLAVRGALEGGVMSAAGAAADDVVQDTPITGEKMFAAFGHGAFGGAVVGFGLGTTGSLVASGVRGAASKISGLRGAARAGEAEGAAAGQQAKLSEGAIESGLRESTPTTAEPPIKLGAKGPVRLGDVEGAAEQAMSPIKVGAPAPARKLGVLDVFSHPNDAARGLAADQAWDAVGAGFGLQSTKFAKQAATYFPNGTRDLGEVALRHNLIDIPTNASPFQAAITAAKSGTPEAIATKADAALDVVGRKIGALTDASGARIQAETVVSALDEVAKKYESAAATRPVGQSVRSFSADILDSLGLRNAGDSARVQDMLRERKAIDRLVFKDAPTLDPKLALEARREIRGKLEDIIEGALDEASGKAKGELAAQYKTLKKDYHALSIISEAAEDSAARASKASTFGLKDLLVGAMGGGGLTGMGMALGGKILRERGNAAAAAFLSRVADKGTLARMLSQTDARVAASAKGLLRETNTASPRASAASRARVDSGRVHTPEDTRKAIAKTQAQAQQVVRWAGDVQANPRKFLSDLEDSAVEVSRTAGPQASSAYTAAAVRALNYLTAAIPAKERRDPLDPRSVPPLTLDEANRVVEAARYAARPMLVFDDFERGKVTPEGMRAAKELVPELLAKYQMHLLDEVQTHMIRGRSLTQGQRLRVDKILEGGAIRPERIARYQADFMNVPQDEEQGPAPEKAGGGPVNMTVENTGFDAVEARKSA